MTCIPHCHDMAMELIMSATTDLKTTTTLAPASKPKLVIDATLPNAVSVKAQADKAFAENTKGNELLGSAQQRMAYAVQCEMALLLAAGSNSIPASMTLASALKNTNDKSTIQAKMVDLFVGEKPSTKDLPDDKTARVDMEHSKRVQLVRRGVEIAAILASRNVTYAMFNVKLGVYMVWSNMLYNADMKQKPLGRIADNDTVLLDGRPFMFSTPVKGGGDKSRGANASVAHMRMICAPPTVKRAGKNASGDTATKGDKDATAINPKSPKSVALHVSLEVMIDALYDIMVTNAPAEPMTRDSLSDKTINRLSAIMLKYDEARKAPTWDAKPVAKRTARGH